MQIYRAPQMAAMGVAVVVDRSSDLVAIDSALDHDQAVEAIAYMIPDAHRDAIEHWVDRVLPTDEPLAMSVPIEDTAFTGFTDPARPPDFRLPPAAAGPAGPSVRHGGAHRRPRPRRHAGPSRPAKWAGRATSALGATGIGAVAAMMAMGPGLANADAWNDPIFIRIASSADMDCTPLQNQPLRAQCVTAGGRVVDAEATLGPDRITYTFTGFGESRAVVIVFSSSAAARKWHGSIGNGDRFPNLNVGERVAVYGSDPAAVKPFLPAFGDVAFSAEDVAPLILRASYAMDLVPEDLAEKMLAEDATLGPVSRSGTPDAVRATAMAIVTGDPRLESEVEMSTEDPLEASPEPVVVEDEPANEKPAPEPEPKVAEEESEPEVVVVVEDEPTEEPAPDEPASTEPSPEPTPEESSPAPEPSQPEEKPAPTPPPAKPKDEPKPEPEAGREEPSPAPSQPEETGGSDESTAGSVCEDLVDELLAELFSEPKPERRSMDAWRERVGPIHDRLAEESCPLLDVEELREVARDRWYDTVERRHERVSEREHGRGHGRGRGDGNERATSSGERLVTAGSR